MPSSNGNSTAACTHLMMLHGALQPRARRAIAFSVSLKRSGDSSVALRSRTRRHGAGQKVALDDGVDDAFALGLRRGDVSAGDDGVERVLRAGEPRQALRAA